MRGFREWIRAGRPDAYAWVRKNLVRLVQFVSGALLVAAAVFVVPERQALASALTGAGVTLIGFGTLLPYIEGPFSFGLFRGSKARTSSVKNVPPTTAAKPQTLRRIELPTIDASGTALPPTATAEQPTEPEEESDA